MNVRLHLVMACAATALAACSIDAVTFTSVGGPFVEDCGAAGDEDGNGLADCDDPVCADAPACQVACGNGRVEAGEGCDDGNPIDGDGCDSNCMVTGCGNGVQSSDEGCDDGNTTSGDGCDNNCTLTACGNGVATSTTGEMCDDGNTVNTDACTNVCLAARCGDGFVRTGVEMCDDANTSNNDACMNTCVAARCGDGFLRAGVETCDDGNTTSGDGCDANCKPTGCGNGVVTAGEGCDDGNTTSGDGCDANCKPTGCGNGIVTAGEQCDDGNTDNTDPCVNCMFARCGDSFVRAGVEDCDDGNVITEACPYGVSSCVVCDSTCHMVAGAMSFCGDGIVQTGFELCDDGNLTCGTCNSSCQVFASARSTGNINVIGASSFRQSGDTFLLNDGINPPLTFELVRDGAPGNPVNIAIQILSGMSPAQVRTCVIDAINSIPGSLLLYASPVGATGSLIALAHERFTRFGNTPILETVVDPGFTVSGMSGGAGGDCLSAQSCRSNADCVSNVCTFSVCQ